MRIALIAVPAAVIAIVVTLLIAREVNTAGGSPAGSGSPIATSAAESTPTSGVSATPDTMPSATPTPTPTPEPTATLSPAEREDARYRASLTARDQGDLDAAIAGFGTIAASEGPLAPFARLRRAQALLANAEYERAADSFAAALEDPALPSFLAPIARREGAIALEEAGRVDEAATWLTLVIDDLSMPAGERSAARWERARIRRSVENPLWIDDAIAVVTSAPGTAAGLEALDALETAEEPVPALPAAYVRYLARQNDEATARYEAIIDDPATDAATAAIASFYLGALSERVPDRGAAIVAYSQSLDLDPVGGWADDAAYWRGRVAEEQGDFVLAVASYDLVSGSYPASVFAADARLRAALAEAGEGNVDAALERLAAIVDGSSGSTAAEAARWHEVLAGDGVVGDVPVPLPAELDPRDISAILSLAGGSVLGPPRSEAIPAGLAGDEAAIDEWLAAEVDAATPAPSISLDEHVFDTLVPRLVAAGERSLARALVLAEVDAHPDDPTRIEIARRARGLGLDDVALLASIRVLAPLSTEERLATPAGLERLAYPAPHRAALDAAAGEFGVPPLLLLALVRQESAFEPAVISPAGAIGLTQVIPATGLQIATALDEAWEGPSSLTEPAISLRYGAAYLAAQLEAFDGNLFAALAAYNGGPSNAARWLDDQRWPGADGYIHAIDFEETRRYVRSVVEQYAWYRYVYGLADAPSLP